MWMQLASAVLGSGVLNAPENPGAPPAPNVFTSGDWNVNMGGSGVSLQGGQAIAMPTVLIVAGVVLVAVWMLRK